MNRIIPIGIVCAVVGIIIITMIFSGDAKPIPPVTQHDLRILIDQWMKNPDKDDRNQRLEIMKAYYTFEESGQKLSDDQEGRVMLNQIRKMVSFDIPKTELDQMKEEIRDELRQLGFKIES
ncbi:proteinase inhibitor [Nitrosarchaeum sp. AC2]|uniref:proteinase inhibitor n=1 Tax=Nitrosarchaeum sp. AC2 TaxID=2259673 RepID=UPI0015C8A4E2|nr:proteinase inhibitor [Nitrosarchaeum sp. AC2]QLH11319.1 proteinase inhibitor [Nitrosarchaeum sp. AC2]